MLVLTNTLDIHDIQIHMKCFVAAIAALDSLRIWSKSLFFLTVVLFTRETSMKICTAKPRISKHDLGFNKQQLQLWNGRILLNLAGNGGQFIGVSELEFSSHERGQRIQGEQTKGSSSPMCFLPNSFSRSCIYSHHCQIPFIVPHLSTFCPIQKGLQFIRQQNLFFGSEMKNSPYRLNTFRPFCKDVDLLHSDFDCENESYKIEINQEELERVCKVINETFAIDRNMEAVLDKCGVNLSDGLVLAMLHRFKHAWKPAFRFFCWAAERSGFRHNSITYNAMMSVLGKSRQFETMVSVLEEMGKKGLLSVETFIICLKAFAAAKERKKAVGMFDLMKKYKFKADVAIINCLLDALGRAKLAKEAQVLFEKLEERFTPNLKTYTILLNGWCTVKNLLEAGKTWNQMIDVGFKPDIIAHNIMLEGLLRCQKRSDAIKLFEVMKFKGPCPNVRSYTMLIHYLSKHGNMEEAVDYLNDMLDSGCEPDAAVYTCLMSGFAHQKKMEMVYRYLTEMNEKGCPPDGRTFNALIKMMSNQRMPDDALNVYKKMIQCGVQPSIHTYNMLMKLFFIVRNYEMGCAVWEEMKKKGCCPDENTYTVLIGGLIRQGRSNEACKYLEEMIDKGMKAPQIDYKKFTADFSPAGRPNNMMNQLSQKMRLSENSGLANLFERWER